MKKGIVYLLYCKDNVSILEKVSVSESDSTLRTFASNNLPLVREYLETANTILDRLNKK